MSASSNSAVRAFRFARRPLILASAVTLFAAPVGAQARRRVPVEEAIRNRVPVTVALVDRLPDESAPAIILRRANASPRDVILLKRSAATPAQLSAAIFTLQVVRAQGGDTARSDVTVRVRATDGPRAWKERTEPKLASSLGRLRDAAPQTIVGVGVAPSYELFLRPNALAGKLTPAGQ